MIQLSLFGLGRVDVALELAATLPADLRVGELPTDTVEETARVLRAHRAAGLDTYAPCRRWVTTLCGWLEGAHAL